MNDKRKLVIITLLVIGIICLLIGCCKIMNSKPSKKTTNNEVVDNGITKYKGENIVSDTLLYSNNDVDIKIKNAIYKENYLEVQFSLTNKSTEIYNFSINRLKVNNCLITFGTPFNDSNFSGVNLGVEPNKTSDNYIIYIWYNDLELRDITDISTMSFKLILYKNEKETKDFGLYKDGYIDIKTSQYDLNKEYDLVLANKPKLYSDDIMDIYKGHIKEESGKIKAIYLIINNKTSKTYQLQNHYLTIDGEKIESMYSILDNYILFDNAYDYYFIPKISKDISSNSQSIKYSFSLYDNETKKLIKDISLDIR